MSCSVAASAPAVAQHTMSSLLRGLVVTQHYMHLSHVLRLTVQGIAAVAKVIPAQQYVHTLRLLFVRSLSVR